MPTIDTPFLLDLLLGLIVLLFVPFGIRRGAAKEATVSAGILFGALLASTWAERGGAELATRFGLDSQVAPFVVATAALFGGALLGYGGGAALGHVPQGWVSHLTGGLLAILNGVLALTYLLSYLNQYQLMPNALSEGVVAETLLQRFEVFQLAVLGGLIVIVLLGIVVSTVRQQSQPRPAAPMPARQRPVRVARDGESGKYEPDEPPVAAPERHQATLDQTAPLLERPRRPWDAPSPSNGNGNYQTWSAPPATNGQSSQQDSGDIWERRSAAASWSAGAAPGPGQAGYGYAAGGESSASRCPSCGAAVGPRDLFCPSCGKTV